MGGSDGSWVGFIVGVPVVGRREGDTDGRSVGALVGTGDVVGGSDPNAVGSRVGETEGGAEGFGVSGTVGLAEGVEVGPLLGAEDGDAEGTAEGAAVGGTEGLEVGPLLGAKVCVGLGVGDEVQGELQLSGQTVDNNSFWSVLSRHLVSGRSATQAQSRTRPDPARTKVPVRSRQSIVGDRVGLIVGLAVGRGTVGAGVGIALGVLEGAEVGEADGPLLGLGVGALVEGGFVITGAVVGATEGPVDETIRLTEVSVKKQTRLR